MQLNSQNKYIIYLLGNCVYNTVSTFETRTILLTCQYFYIYIFLKYFTISCGSYIIMSKLSINYI